MTGGSLAGCSLLRYPDLRSRLQLPIRYRFLIPE